MVEYFWNVMKDPKGLSLTEAEVLKTLKSEFNIDDPKDIENEDDLVSITKFFQARKKAAAKSEGLRAGAPRIAGRAQRG